MSLTNRIIVVWLTLFFVACAPVNAAQPPPTVQPTPARPVPPAPVQPQPVQSIQPPQGSAQPAAAPAAVPTEVPMSMSRNYTAIATMEAEDRAKQANRVKLEEKHLRSTVWQAVGVVCNVDMFKASKLEFPNTGNKVIAQDSYGYAVTFVVGRDGALIFTLAGQMDVPFNTEYDGANRLKITSTQGTPTRSCEFRKTS